jgi:hypothetical protein
MKSVIIFICGVILFMFLGAISVSAQQNPGDVWVEPHPLPNGTAIPGYWRPPFKMGFYWVEGRDDNHGNWIPGHWNPVPGSNSNSNQVWAPGYYNGVIWVEGFWRPGNRPGYIWRDPSWRNNRWNDGHWRAYEGGQPWKQRYPRP